MANQYTHLLMRGHFDWWDNMESDIAMKTKTTASTSTIPITVPEQENEDACLVRQQFEWWEDVENDIVMKTKAIPPASSVPITAPKLDEKYGRLLIREHFDWWEEVNNDITKETKALTADTRISDNNISNTDTANLAAAFTSPTTASNLDDACVRLYFGEYCNSLQDLDNDTPMNVNALTRETDIPISDTKSLATAFTGPNTASNLDDACIRLSFREYCNSLEDGNDTPMDAKALVMDTNIPIPDTRHLDATSIGPSVTKKLDEEYAEMMEIFSDWKIAAFEPSPPAIEEEHTPTLAASDYRLENSPGKTDNSGRFFYATHPPHPITLAIAQGIAETNEEEMTEIFSCEKIAVFEPSLPAIEEEHTPPQAASDYRLGNSPAKTDNSERSFHPSGRLRRTTSTRDLRDSAAKRSMATAQQKDNLSMMMQLSTKRSSPLSRSGTYNTYSSDASYKNAELPQIPRKKKRHLWKKIFKKVWQTLENLPGGDWNSAWGFV